MKKKRAVKINFCRSLSVFYISIYYFCTMKQEFYLLHPCKYEDFNRSTIKDC